MISEPSKKPPTTMHPPSLLSLCIKSILASHPTPWVVKSCATTNSTSTLHRLVESGILGKRVLELDDDCMKSCCVFWVVDRNRLVEFCERDLAAGMTTTTSSIVPIPVNTQKSQPTKRKSSARASFKPLFPSASKPSTNLLHTLSSTTTMSTATARKQFKPPLLTSTSTTSTNTTRKRVSTGSIKKESERIIKQFPELTDIIDQDNKLKDSVDELREYKRQLNLCWRYIGEDEHIKVDALVTKWRQACMDVAEHLRDKLNENSVLIPQICFPELLAAQANANHNKRKRDSFWGNDDFGYGEKQGEREKKMRLSRGSNEDDGGDDGNEGEESDAKLCEHERVCPSAYEMEMEAINSPDDTVTSFPQESQRWTLAFVFRSLGLNIEMFRYDEENDSFIVA